MKVLLVLNPISGGNDKAAFLKKAKAFCTRYAIALDVFRTTGKNDLANLEKAVNDYAPNRIAAAGGDGTFALCAEALLKAGIKTPVGIVPFGSANGMAKELKVPDDTLQAFKDICNSKIQGSLDVLMVNHKHMLLHIGDVGINARIVKQFEADKNRGMLTYGKYFVKELSNSKTFELSLRIGDKEYEEDVYMLAICNARKFGTGVPLNKISNPFDGLFELVAIRSIEVDQILSAGLAALNQDLLSVDKSKAYQTDEATIAFKEPQLLQIDGEVIGEVNELNIAVKKGAVNFISTADNAYLEN